MELGMWECHCMYESMGRSQSNKHLTTRCDTVSDVPLHISVVGHYQKRLSAGTLEGGLTLSHTAVCG